MPWSLSFFCLLHLFLAGMGMYFLARRWTGSNMAGAVAGLIFTFNGLSLNFLMWPSHLATFALIPWVLLAGESACLEGRRKIIPAALLGALQFLAGGPESILFTWVILFCLMSIHFLKNNAPRRALVLRFLAIGILMGALISAQLFPFLDLVAHSQRDKNYGTTDWAMPTLGWGNFLLPVFQSTHWHGLLVQTGQFWTTSYYGGIATMLLAAVALWRERSWRVWLVGALFLSSIILALGDNGLVYAWLRHFIPAIGFARYPVKFTILSLWALPVLAAFGWRYFENLNPGVKPKSQYLFAALFALAILLMLRSTYLHPMEEGIYPVVQQNGLCRLAFLAVSLATLHFFLTRPAWRKCAAFAFLLFVWFDLVSHTPWQNPGVNPDVYAPGLARLKLNLNPEPALGQSRLMISPNSMSQVFYKAMDNPKDEYLVDRVVFMSDCNLIDNLPKAEGMFSLYLRDMHQILGAIGPDTAPARLDQIEDLMSVSQTIAPGKVFDWIPRTNYLPMISAGQKPVFADEKETLHALLQETVDLRQTVYLPKEAAGVITVKEKSEVRISNIKFGAEKISFAVQAQTTAIIFISQAYYHHWKAYVDGNPTTLWHGNAAFQALETSGGQHEIKLIYEDRIFHYGAAISITALLACALAWFIPRRKSSL